MADAARRPDLLRGDLGDGRLRLPGGQGMAARCFAGLRPGYATRGGTTRARRGASQPRPRRRRGQRLLRHAHGPKFAVLSRHPDPPDRLRPGAGDALPGRGAEPCRRTGEGDMTMRAIYGAAPADLAGYDTDRLR